TSTLMNWTATPATVSGGGWLQVSPSSGTSDPKLPPPSITITANASSLAAGDYYGTVSIRSDTSLQVISVVLSVLTPDKSPGVVVEPTGVVFLVPPGGNAPPAKTVRISNPTTVPLTFTTSLSFSTAASWFQIQPTTGSVTPTQPITVNIQPNASLTAGVLTGSVTFTFSDGTMRVVSLVAVVAPGISGGSVAPFAEQTRSAACTPTKLLPVFTLLGVNFTSPVAWPANIEAFVVDDCGTPVASGSVAASFSNGDPPVGLLATQAGRYSGTWTPRNPVNANMNVTLTAQTFTPALKGTVTVSGAAPANPNVPIVSFGGVVGTASYVASPAPGTLISIFGSALADDVAGASALPLPTQLLSTQVILGGVTVPLVFVSGGQINAQVPYRLPTKATYQVIVQRGTAISTPESVGIGDGQPAVFTTDLSGGGQGHIYRITSAGAQILASPGAAVTAGDVVTVYCSGLGEVNPATVTAGSPAPLDVLENTANPVTATIGDMDAKVLFAGLTPGFTGLYQVNLVIPGGVTPSDSAPLVLTVAGQVSQPVTLAVR
ncbi:MAG TPA: BACON domain-containing carbohydrate-binding protein, partial [Bryobacteraceae bacterium]|nr:BACON domain-containing carbohydrate-binding protein [Bryobacteraceae bacterium]